jgi:hypothetical protein
MVQQKLARTAAATVASLGLVVGLAGMVGASSNNTGTISGNGAFSMNDLTTKNINKTHVHNDNDVTLKNNNPQHAYSGNADTSFNTGGDASAMSGVASNSSNFRASVTLNNSSALGGGGGSSTNSGTISGNGAYSTSTVKTVNVNTLNVNNDNDVRITNNNSQHASSGDATSSFNTGGDASAVSGAATNTSSSEFTVNITN